MFIIIIIIFFNSHRRSWEGLAFFFLLFLFAGEEEEGRGGGGWFRSRESTADSTGLLFAHEVRHEIELILPQPEFRQLLDAVQAHLYH